MDQYFSQLQTEGLNQSSENIDQYSIEEILRCINKEDKKVPMIVEAKIPEIAQVVDVIQKNMKKGGRLIYFGAGTSGRLGVLDASECVPTFGVSAEIVQGYIAGGDKALRVAQEGCEDNEELGETDLRKCNPTSVDSIIGISASGSAKYVQGVIKEAKRMGAFTVAIVNNQNSLLKEYANQTIELITGPEVISGSTRMKAGTAQKLVLNMLTTATMIRLGKVYRNLMVDLKATNQKLEERSIRIFCEATGKSEEVAKKTLEMAHGETKLAILMGITGKSREACKNLLDVNDGFLRKALD